MADTSAKEKTLDVAIIGGGIAGLTLALGLSSRNVNVRIYERGHSFREIGAGIGFTPNAEWAMRVLDPRIHAAFKRVAAQNANDWFRWVNGYSQNGAEDGVDGIHEDLIYKMYLGERGFEGCHRADFLDELVKMMPEGGVEFSKNLHSIDDRGDGEKLRLNFRDGSSEEADAVIGCDGIRSRVRQLVLGEDKPASYPRYTHKYAFRGLIPMERAQAALGEEKTQTRHMHLGLNAHALTFPVAGGKLLNVVAFVTDPEEWPYKEKFTAPATKSEAVAAFKDFNPAVRAIMDLLPENLDKWAVFDYFDNPAPTYVRGRVCISGDAAHASAPYHGAGAGFCIEDAAVLAALLETVAAATTTTTVRDNPPTEDPTHKAALLRTAFKTYDTIRRERNQWLVESSRFVGEMYEWRDPEIGRDARKVGHEIEWRSRRIWDFDVGGMMGEVGEVYGREVKVQEREGGMV